MSWSTCKLVVIKQFFGYGEPSMVTLRKSRIFDTYILIYFNYVFILNSILCVLFILFIEMFYFLLYFLFFILIFQK